MNLAAKNIEDLHSLYKKREISAEEVVKDSLKRIDETDKKLSAFSYINRENIIKEAKELDKEGIPDNPPPLWGIPVALKDNMCIKGTPSTCGSKILQGYVSPYDGAMAEKLRGAKALVVGTCHMDEFAMGSSCESNAYAVVKNPYDLSRVPGGSSGGSAVAVAANDVVVSLGSDTGGSIRQPASFCGLIGLKPTYGLVSRFGLIAYASSLDQIGPFSRSVKDTACVLEAIAGFDKRDSTSHNFSVPDYKSYFGKDIKGLKIGLPKEYYTDGINQDIINSMNEAKKVFSGSGAELIDISLPHTEYAIAAYYILATAEASANLARYDGIKYGKRADNCRNLREVYIKSRSEGFGAEVKRRIILGTFVLSSGYYDAYYLKAQKARTFIKNDFDEAFRNVDIIMTPTTPYTAFKIGEKIDDPVSMYLSDIFTVSVNLAGLPALSMPCGTDKNNLPEGMQLIAPALREDLLLNTAYHFEQSSGFLTPNLAV